MKRNSPPNTTAACHPRAQGAVYVPAEARRPDLKQLNELEARLEEEHVCLRQLRETLEQDQAARGGEGAARHRDRDVNRHIVEDVGGHDPLVFSMASQNVMAAALLLRAMTEPLTPMGRRVR